MREQSEASGVEVAASDEGVLGTESCVLSEWHAWCSALRTQHFSEMEVNNGTSGDHRRIDRWLTRSL